MNEETVKLITPGEAAQLFRVSLNTIYRLLREHQIPHWRVGRQIYFDRQELLNVFRKVGQTHDR